MTTISSEVASMRHKRSSLGFLLMLCTVTAFGQTPNTGRGAQPARGGQPPAQRGQQPATGGGVLPPGGLAPAVAQANGKVFTLDDLHKILTDGLNDDTYGSVLPNATFAWPIEKAWIAKMQQEVPLSKM